MANLIEILIKASSGQATSELEKFDNQLDNVGVSGQKASDGLSALNEATNKLILAQRKAEDATGKLAAAERELANNTNPGRQRELETQVIKARVAVDHANASVRRYSNEVDHLSTTTKKGIGSWTELSSAISVTERVLAAGKRAIDETIGVTIKYAEEVRDLSRALGTSTEEASKLLQIADDLKIETTQLQLAFRYAINKGIDPSIDGLKDLAAEYQGIEDPIKRAQFAMEKFGTRGGLAMQKVLEKTPDQLDAMAESAEKAGLILSEDAVKAAREYEIAMDDLADSVQGLKINIGTGLVPKVIDLTNLMNDLIAVEGEDWFMDVSRASADFINSFIYGKKPIEDTARVLRDDLLPTMEGYTYTGSEMIDHLHAQRAGFEELSPVIDEVAGRTAKLNTKQQELLENLRKSAGEISSYWTDVNRGVAGDIEDTIQNLEFRMAGGGVIEQQLQAVNRALAENKITPEKAKELYGELFVQAQNIQVELGEIDATEAAQNISDTLGVKLGDANDLMKEIEERSPMSVEGQIIIQAEIQGSKLALWAAETLMADAAVGAKIGGETTATGGAGETTGPPPIIGPNPKRHTGGPVAAGQMYDTIPGEFFIPDRDGYVTPPRQIGSIQPDAPTTATAAAAAADSGAINNYNYHIYNPAAMAMALDEQRRASSRNLNASAGR